MGQGAGADGGSHAGEVSRPRIYYMNTGPWPYYIGFTTSGDAFERELKRLGINQDVRFISGKHANASTHHLINHGTAMSIICVQPFNKRVTREQFAALIAHEAMHVVQEMRDHLGDLGCEAEAYLIQQIVQEGLQIAWATGKEARKEPVA